MNIKRRPVPGFKAPTTLDESKIEDARLWAVIGASLAVSCAISAAVLVNTPARGEERWFYFRLYSGPRGTPIPLMKEKLRAGPMPELSVCLAVGALSIQELNDRNPDVDFAGACDDAGPAALRELAERAIRLLPPKGPQS